MEEIYDVEDVKPIIHTAKITFLNGTELETEVNGTCYIIDNKPEFPEDLSEVVVVTDDETITYNNATVQECASIDGRYWFTFLSVSDEELKVMKNEAQVFYTAMMTDTLLEEE